MPQAIDMSFATPMTSPRLPAIKLPAGMVHCSAIRRSPVPAKTRDGRAGAARSRLGKAGNLMRQVLAAAALLAAAGGAGAQAFSLPQDTNHDGYQTFEELSVWY